MADYIDLPVEGGGGGSGFANPATTDLNMGAFNIKRAGGNSIWDVFPSGGDDSVAINAALNAATLAGGGTVNLVPGATYILAHQVDVPTAKYMCAVHLKGNGAYIHVTADMSLEPTNFIFAFRGTQYINGGALSNVTKGDTTITVSTHSDALNWQPGDVIAILGTDADSLSNVEYHTVLTVGNGTTGVVALNEPILRTMTSVTAYGWGSVDNTNCANNYNSIEDITFDIDTQTVDCFPIYVNGQLDFLAKNLIINDWANTTASEEPAIEVDNCFNARIEGCEIYGANRRGIRIDHAYQSTIVDCRIYDIVDRTLTGGGIDILSCMDCIVRECSVIRAGDTGLRFSGSGAQRRNEVISNEFYDIKNNAISVDQGYETTIQNNRVELTVSGAGLYNVKHRNVYDGNILISCKYPFLSQGGNNLVVTNNQISNSQDSGMIFSVFSKNCVIANNSINGGGLNGNSIGIYLSQVTNSIVSNNVFSNYTGKGIFCESSADRNLITGNYIDSVSSDGIKIANDSDYAFVTGNQLVSCTINQGTSTHNVFSNNNEI